MYGWNELCDNKRKRLAPWKRSREQEIHKSNLAADSNARAVCTVQRTHNKRGLHGSSAFWSMTLPLNLGEACAVAWSEPSRRSCQSTRDAVLLVMKVGEQHCFRDWPAAYQATQNVRHESLCCYGGLWMERQFATAVKGHKGVLSLARFLQIVAMQQPFASFPRMFLFRGTSHASPFSNCSIVARFER